MVAANGRVSVGGMTRLLGIDEGTSAVKAVLYDADLRQLAEARREKALSHPKPGWVEQDPEEVLAAVVAAVADVLRDSPEEITACGLDHQGESVLAWDAESGRALTPIVTWQDKRSQVVLDRLEAEGRGDEVRQRSRMPLDPYFSAGKLAWLLEHDSSVREALGQGTLRLGTVDSFLCDRLGAGFATDPSTASRTQLGAPAWDPVLLAIFGVPAEVLPAIAACLARAGEILALVKPQFELGRERVGRGGVVRSAADRRDALLSVAALAPPLSLGVGGFASSGLPGPKGNRETFILLTACAPGLDDVAAAALLAEPGDAGE